MPADFYDVLGVDSDASADDIKRAYRGRVREFHPDVNDSPDADRQFRLVRIANDTLSDPAERKDYDRLGHREYVETHLDDVPPVTVLGDELDGIDAQESTTGSEDADGRADDSGAATESTTSRSATTTATGSASGSSSSTNGSGTGTTTGTGGSASAGGTTTSTSASTATDASTSTTGSTSTRRSNGSSGTGSATDQRRGRSGSRRERAQRTDDAEESAWDGVTPGGDTDASRSTAGGTASSGRRDGLARWYPVVVVALVGYLAGLGIYARGTPGAVRSLVGSLSGSPVAGLTGAFPLPSPWLAARAAVLAPSLETLFPVGLAVLPLVLGVVVVRYGKGTARLYGLAALVPAAAVVGWPYLPGTTWLALLTLVVVPVLGALGFLVDVGRYLLATR